LATLTKISYKFDELSAKDNGIVKRAEGQVDHKHGVLQQVASSSGLLFSWRYNPLLLYFHSPVAGFSLLVFEVS
jgi:hypothetical protein